MKTRKRRAAWPGRSCRKPFPPQAAAQSDRYRIAETRETNRSRQEHRVAIVRDTTPAEFGLAGAAQVALIIRTVTEKGHTTTTYHHVVTSRPAARLAAAGLRALRRGHWGIEADCHQRLDVSLHEDQLRVRSTSGVATLGLLARVSLALFEQWCQGPRLVRDKTYPVWSGRQKKQPSALLRRLLQPCLGP